MGFLNFDDYICNENHLTETKVNTNESYHFEANESYSNENRKEVDELLYEYACNYCDDADEASLEGLWNYINEDTSISEEQRNEIGEYIDACSESIEDTFGEL